VDHRAICALIQQVRWAVYVAHVREYRTIVSDNRRWQHFVHRPGDVFVCTPSKCGTTWMQTIVNTLMFPDGAPGPVMVMAPWLDARFDPVEVLLERLDAQTHRRALKTHTPADGIPWFPDASYITVNRDGRDVFMSMYNHMRTMRQDVTTDLAMSAAREGIDLGSRGLPNVDDEHAFFPWWLENAGLLEHVASFWERRGEPNLLFVHYDDMTIDLEGEMRRVAAFLAIEIDEAKLPGMVERCTFAGMKARPDDIGPFERRFVGGAESFLYKGTNGRWRDVMTDAELDAYQARVAEMLPPDAAVWLAGRSAIG